MRITRNPIPTQTGPDEWFTGTVYIDLVGEPIEHSGAGSVKVHFTPGSRTAWHHHPHGQSLYVVEGICLMGRRNQPVERVYAGERVWIEPDEEHWHGAAPDSLMTHIAVAVADEAGVSAIWGDHVTDREYQS